MSPPDHAEVARTALRALAEQVEAAEDLREAAALTAAFFDPHGGVADAFTSVLWAVSRHFEARIGEYDDADPAYTQWHRLAAIAEAHSDLTDGLAGTPNAFRLLDPRRPDPHNPTTQQEQALAVSPLFASRTPTEPSATTNSSAAAPAPAPAHPPNRSTPTNRR